MNKHAAPWMLLETACVAGWILVSCAAPDRITQRPATVIQADARQAAQLVAEGQVVVLDIRTPEEFAAGHIRGAKNIDFHAPDFTAQLAKLDREQSYLLHCRSGRRSSNALSQFTTRQFQHVVHLEGGILAWEAAGNPVTRQ
jgi:rhodanese-related sulfurtransferase